MKRWKEQLLNRNWLAMNEETAFKKIFGCNKTTELWNLRKLLHRISS